MQKEYYSNLDPNNINTTKSFFQNFKPFFSSKYTHSEKLIIVEKGEILSNDIHIAECMNNYFINITDTLDIKEWPTNAEFESLNDPIDKALLKYAQHPSIEQIKTEFDCSNVFKFQNIQPKEVIEEIKKLDESKGTSGDIPVKFIKEYSYLFINSLTDCINTAINNNQFPDILKLADVTPVFKKGCKTDKENYRPISVLKPIAKIFERLLYKQIIIFMDNKFSPLLCGFRKGHNTQHALLKLLDNWREKLDNKQYVGVILCDLSKAFDTLPHDLLIAKLHAYGIGNDSIKLISNYLTNRKQRCKVGSSYSPWSDIVNGVPQGSVLGPLLFNIFINDFFFSIKSCDTCNFADDNTIYSSGKNIHEVTYQLEDDIQNALNWFKDNRMVANPKKFQFMILGTRSKTKLCLDVDGKKCISTTSVTLLGIEIDWKLNFNIHANKICSIATNKAKSLARLRFKLNQSQKLCLYHCYIMSNFGYCPVIWMFCGKVSNNNMNKVQLKALRAVYNNFSLNLDELLEMGNHTTIHDTNNRLLLCEVYKCMNNLNPTFLSDVFKPKNLTYNLRTSNLLALPKLNTVTGKKSFTFRGSLAWNILPDHVKNCDSLAKFKLELKKLKVIKCSCNICT